MKTKTTKRKSMRVALALGFALVATMALPAAEAYTWTVGVNRDGTCVIQAGSLGTIECRKLVIENPGPCENADEWDIGITCVNMPV